VIEDRLEYLNRYLPSIPQCAPLTHSRFESYVDVPFTTFQTVKTPVEEQVTAEVVT